MSAYHSIGDVIGRTDLPDPTIPVPFEQFAALGNSNDMLARAAFWAYYTAWTIDRHGTDSVAVGVRARNDAHTLRAVCKELELKDCLMIRREDLDELHQALMDMAGREHVRPNNTYLWPLVGASGFIIGILVVLSIWWRF